MEFGAASVRWSPVNLIVRIVLIETLLVLALCPDLSSGESAPPSEIGVPPELIARVTKLANIDVEFQQTTTYMPPPNLVAPEQAVSSSSGEWIARDGQLVSRCRYRRANSLVSYREEPQSTTMARPERYLVETEEAHSGSRVERRRGMSGTILDSDRLPLFSPIDLALGGRFKASQTWLTPDELSGFSTTNHPDGSMLLCRNIKSVEGGAIVNQWTVDPARGCAIVEYERMYWYDTKGSERPSDVESWRTDIRVENDDFRVVDGLVVPFKSHVEQYFTSDEGVVTGVTVVDLEVVSYRIGDVNQDEEEFLIKWPAGAVVKDTRTERVHQVLQGGVQLTDKFLSSSVLGTELVQRPDDTRAVRWLLWINIFVGSAVVVAMWIRRIRQN